MTNKEKYAEDLHSIFLNSFGVDEENNKPFRCARVCRGHCKFYNNEKELKHCISIQGENDEIPVGYRDVYICKKCLKKHIIKY